ncbi:MAG TPA: bifunctional glutamate N-acetyltransferase/amino-acid acetyltransferase ArgJ [Acidimicrobiia bacterium]|nr:bifunctional glutamate N-acetyltransferase/amino-acid acetyltransferase ArgJ [Acidimicrobiia bacterium]
MSVTAAPGFVAAGAAAGIKPSGGLDLAVVIAHEAVAAAGVFTRNRAAAAPVTLSRRRLMAGMTRAVVLNSGSANAGTGPDGMTDAEHVTGRMAELVGADPNLILMCSTGPIGPRLPVSRMIDALPGLVGSASSDGGSDAAEAILTTDSRAKTTVVHGEGFVVGGMAKGSGMLRPDMATMLCVLTTDAAVDSATLSVALAGAVPTTFNSLNVDGCESTNDSVILLASGRGAPIARDEFGSVVESACRNLAYEMAADAEGASRVVKLRMSGAADDESARRFGRAIADSALVRSSFYGGDPNWGRILAVLGACQVEPSDVSIAYEGTRVADRGFAYPFDDQKLAKLLTGDFVVDVAVGRGDGAAEILTTDLTPDYVRFNGERS